MPSTLYIGDVGGAVDTPLVELLLISRCCVAATSSLAVKLAIAMSDSFLLLVQLLSHINVTPHEAYMHSAVTALPYESLHIYRSRFGASSLAIR